jgi:hypothetical protein
MESQFTISPPTITASFKARLLFPLAVGPKTEIRSDSSLSSENFIAGFKLLTIPWRLLKILISRRMISPW